jgi:hypothetical protein
MPIADIGTQCRPAHRNPRSYTGRSMFEKRGKLFQQISTLFCEVKRGFEDP